MPFQDLIFNLPRELESVKEGGLRVLVKDCDFRWGSRWDASWFSVEVLVGFDRKSRSVGFSANSEDD